MKTRAERYGNVIRLYSERPADRPCASRVFDALHRARLISGLSPAEFVDRLFERMGSSTAEALKALEGFNIFDRVEFSRAVEEGRLVPSGEALIAAALVAECPVGVLCGDGPMADDYFRLRLENRQLKTQLAAQGPGADALRVAK